MTNTVPENTAIAFMQNPGEERAEAQAHTTESDARKSVPTAKVALLSPPFAELSYLLPAGFSADFWKPGLRLAVPVGKSLRAAVLMAVEPLNVAEAGFRMKELGWPLEHTAIVSSRYLDLAVQFALRQAQPPGRVLANMLPAGLRDTAVTLRFFPGGGHEDYDLKAMQLLDHETRSSLAVLWEAGQGNVLRRLRSADEEVYRLSVAPPWPVRPSAVRQLAVLDFLAVRGQCSRRNILRECGGEALAALRQLTRKGLLELRAADDECHIEQPVSVSGWLKKYQPLLESSPPFALNEAQKEALEGCLESLAEAMPGKGTSRLLYGVTGSGKTAVYLELAARVLCRGRSVLLLAPEVALALKLREDVRRRFPELPVHLFHGYQTQAAREACFRSLAGREAPALVVGTRSALFLPLSDVGLIVLDEEHDGSFKQDERLTYQAKELAWYLVRQSGGLLLLGSATPDIKTFYAVEEGALPMHHLPARVGGGALPEVALSPMPPGLRGGALTHESSEALMQCVSAGEQAVILLNRRGYAPCMFCLDCGTVARCPHCEVPLSYHKKREKLVCHYCGYTLPFPSPCSNCGSLHFLPMGDGTEKLEEFLAASLPPGTGVMRLDRDSTAKPGEMERILAGFAKGEAQVLVGTQMLSKGHHFPNVTLAIVVDGDLGLNMPDYNAAEKTFQLLLQAAGRAGRGEKPGRVIIQTRNPDHYCWQYVLQNDYEGFYHQELERRRKRGYPPFVRLALLRVTYPQGWQPGGDYLVRLGKFLKEQGRELGVKVLGPAPAPYPMRERKMRFQCLLKGKDWQSMRGLYLAVSKIAPQSAPVTLNLDLDPNSML